MFLLALADLTGQAYQMLNLGLLQVQVYCVGQPVFIEFGEAVLFEEMSGNRPGCSHSKTAAAVSSVDQNARDISGRGCKSQQGASL